MALVPHKIVALAQSDAEGTGGQNIVAGASVSLFDSGGAAVFLHDDENGSNPSTAKTTDSNGVRVVWVTPGEYDEAVNGSTLRKVSIGGNSAAEVSTFSELQLYRPVNTGQAFVCQERHAAKYILQDVGYSAQPGDVTFANSRVGQLQISDHINAGWFGLVGDGSTDNSTAINDAMNKAAVVVESLLTDKIDAVEYSVKIPDGDFAYTALDVPSGVMLEGNGSSSVLRDVGASTSRASINVGTTARESFRAGLKKLTVIGGRLAGRDGINFERALRMCGLFECTIFDFDNNVVNNDSWAFTFDRNAIYSAVSNNFKLQNAVATRFSGNRIESAGQSNVVIDGETGQEPITVTFNGDVLQGARRHAIDGVDVVSLEVYDCFIEGNNQDGGFAAINLNKGSQNRQGEVLHVSGGFFTPGTGFGEIAINANGFKHVSLDPIFIRGGLWNTPIRVNSDCEYLKVSGQVTASGSVFSGQSESCVVEQSVSDLPKFGRGIIEQRKISRIRTSSSNIQSQAIDATIVFDTSSNNCIYEIRAEDIVDGRTFTVQKSTGDANRIVIRTVGAEPVNGGTEFFKDGPYESITVVCNGGEVYAS